MDWFYVEMVRTHVILAWVSLLMFLVRGLVFQFNEAWAMDDRLRVIVFGVDTLLTITGLSLWVLLHYTPMRDTWLLMKLIVLVIYVFCAHVAMGRSQFNLLGYLAALLTLAYMMAVSYLRSPWIVL